MANDDPLKAALESATPEQLAAALSARLGNQPAKSAAEEHAEFLSALLGGHHNSEDESEDA